MESPGPLLSRLRELQGYHWDENIEPFHSSYDNWHFYGTQYVPEDDLSSTATSDTQPSKPNTARSIPGTNPRPALNSHKSNGSEHNILNPPSPEGPDKATRVVARVSTHMLRLEREYNLSKLVSQSDPDFLHFVRPIELVRLSARNGHDAMVVSIFEAPGDNYLRGMVEFGPNAYKGTTRNGTWNKEGFATKDTQIPLQQFLDFAIGATEALEILHHGHGLVHGELRGDAFHFNEATGTVKMLNFGSGARSFENGLTSAGWYSLSREVGIEHKLQFIAPEQTGRLPAEPDSRTDIFSLGILFWIMLTGELPREGDTPLIIMQNALSRRVVPVSIKRMDVPEILSQLIQKMTQRNIDERYNSTSGLKYDLKQIQNMLENGDLEGLKAFKIGSKDVSAFFNLPSHMVGRNKEKQHLVKIIEEVAKRQQKLSGRRGKLTNMSVFSSSEMHVFSPAGDDVASDSASSKGSDKITIANGVPPSIVQQHSQESIADSEPSSTDELILNARHGLDLKSSSSMSSSQTDPTTQLLRNATKIRRKGRCEVVSLSGAAGLGKSCLIQSIQVAARSHGYFAAARFDQARKSPFEPALRLMSSLFRQIFSESDVSTDFHQLIRGYVNPVWHVLHTYLDLPSWLLTSSHNGNGLQPTSEQLAATTELHRVSSPAVSSPSGNTSSSGTATDWLRTGGSMKSSRFANIFLGVLRVLASQKFICFAIEDLQFADNESLDLISKVISGKVPILLIVSYRDIKALPNTVKPLIATSIKLQLMPFTENETAEFVASTLHREKDYIVPLVAVIQEKTAGNPFFIREMLDTCYRKLCVYYSWRNSAWEFDLDRIFAEFESQSYGSQITNDFVAKRLDDLIPATRAILAWAALLGTSFSFSLVKRLLQGENVWPKAKGLPEIGLQDAVTGLQGAIDAYLIMPCDKEDRFRFSHDRYLQSALSLPYNKAEMHYAIAKTLLGHRHQDAGTTTAKRMYVKASHICYAADLLRERESVRAPYRVILRQAAEHASDSGARSTAVFYWTHCLKLLQDSAWESGRPDVEYQETLTLHTRTAETFWYLRDFAPAIETLDKVFRFAKSPIDMAPCWIIKSRVYAVQGNSHEAFAALKAGLVKLGLNLPNTTYEACDAEFLQISQRLNSMRQEDLLARPAVVSPVLQAIGPVLVELVSAAFWSNSLLFYQISMIMITTHLTHGEYRQCGLGYLHLGSIAAGRFGMVEWGCKIGDLAQRFFEKYHEDAYTIGRGETLRALFMGHLQTPMVDQLPVLEAAHDASLLVGDRILSLLNLGITAAFKLWASTDLAEVENFCTDAPVDYSGWHQDLRGGVFLLTIRQYTRAMQGKTDYSVASQIFDDEEFQSGHYANFIETTASNHKRPLTIFWSYYFVGLFRFGHIKEAIRLGEKLSEMSESLLCMRFFYSNMLYLCLCFCATLREEPDHPDKESMLQRIDTYLGKIRNATAVNDVNYVAWLSLLEAEVIDLKGNYGAAVTAYESALNHCELNGFTLDEGLVYELYADALIRRGAKRPAVQLLTECLASYRRVGAYGKAQHVATKFEWIIKGSSSLNRAEVACQTTIVDTGNTSYKLEQNDERAAEALGLETPADRTQNWLEPRERRVTFINNGEISSRGLQEQEIHEEFSAMGLDMIDLASILESSQLLSSELQVDKLMAKMVEIMVESTGSELAAIVTQGEETEWNLVATGTPEGVTSYPGAQGFESIATQEPRQITTYILRFKETVFLHNILDDERFSSVSDAFLKSYPEGLSVIGLPILHGGELLGAIYIEGPPNSFTDRNLTVLRLLVNQISISLANALFLRKIEKVGSENAAMVVMQKGHMEKMAESEKRAKAAEVIAISNMKLKEEAAKAKALFLANVSHELRTPLNGVIGMSELLKSTILTEKQEGFADSIRTCADTLLSVINDLLDFTKLEAGKMNISAIPMNLADTIREVVRALSFQNNEKGLRTLLALDDLDSQQLVLGDPLRLHQVFLNLLGNAYKFTSQGSVTVRADRQLDTEDVLEVVLSVQDTGIGIPKEQRLKLFQPFSQVENTSSRTFGGTGLGLSICKALIEKMGGDIWLDSIAGSGTTVSFRVRFKKISHFEAKELLARERAAEMEAKFAPLVGSSTQPKVIDLSTIPREDLRIAIAEDNAINQKIAISFVQRLGFKCEAFADGRKTIDALEKAVEDGNPFHLVLMDVQMPVLDGYDATREIRKHPNPHIRNVLVIAMTASAIQGDREKCLDAGMNNYLAKPVRVQTLKTLLETYLSQAPKSIENLEKKGQQIVKEVLDDVDGRSREKEHEAVQRKDEAKRGSMGSSTMKLPERPRLKEMDSISSEQTVVPDNEA
ncbi:hypothetical protein E2P81_ATG11126 [Venturia nashicola]|nr:hypothetical protein E2P81_ATG11126 [Venturia nashicola]